MTKTNKKYNDNCACAQADTNNRREQTPRDYGFYSNVLKKPFENLADLRKAEYVYFEEQKVKEDKAAQKKADAQKVEDAFKTLNATRKAYKEDLNQLTTEYTSALADLKKAFDAGKADLHAKLAKAEDNYAATLKEFTDKYPEGYHLTLKDGDFETTISGSSKVANKTIDNFSELCPDIFKMIFGL